MAIDRAARAKRRWRRRAAHQMTDAAGAKRTSGGAVLGVEGLFNAGAQHQLAQLRQVELITEDTRESGEGPLDLDSGVVWLEAADQRWQRR